MRNRVSALLSLAACCTLVFGAQLDAQRSGNSRGSSSRGSSIGASRSSGGGGSSRPSFGGSSRSSSQQPSFGGSSRSSGQRPSAGSAPSSGQRPSFGGQSSSGSRSIGSSSSGSRSNVGSRPSLGGTQRSSGSSQPAFDGWTRSSGSNVGSSSSGSRSTARGSTRYEAPDLGSVGSSGSRGVTPGADVGSSSGWYGSRFDSAGSQGRDTGAALGRGGERFDGTDPLDTSTVTGDDRVLDVGGAAPRRVRFPRPYTSTFSTQPPTTGAPSTGTSSPGSRVAPSDSSSRSSSLVERYRAAGLLGRTRITDRDGAQAPSEGREVRALLERYSRGASSSVRTTPPAVRPGTDDVRTRRDNGAPALRGATDYARGPQGRTSVTRGGSTESLQPARGASERITKQRTAGERIADARRDNAHLEQLAKRDPEGVKQAARVGSAVANVQRGALDTAVRLAGGPDNAVKRMRYAAAAGKTSTGKVGPSGVEQVVGKIGTKGSFYANPYAYGCSSFGLTFGASFGYGNWWCGNYFASPFYTSYWGWNWCFGVPYYYSAFYPYYFGYRYCYWPYYASYYSPGYTRVVYETVYVDNDPDVIYVEVPAAQQGEGVVLPAEPVAPPPPAPQPELGDSAEHFLELGDEAFRQGRYAQAVQYYAKAIELAPEVGVLYLVLSDALFATGDYHYAAYAIRRAFKHDPGLATTPVDKHDFYGDPAEFDRQLAVLEQYVLDHPADGDARLVLATNYLFGNRPAAAVDLIQGPFAQSMLADEAARHVLTGAEMAQYGEPAAPVKQE